MKKTLSLLLTALLLAAFAGGLAVSAANPCNCGDVNGDGQININDLLLVRDIIFGTVTPDADTLWAADINSDGNVDLNDLLALRDIIFDVKGNNDVPAEVPSNPTGGYSAERDLTAADQKVFEEGLMAHFGTKPTPLKVATQVANGLVNYRFTCATQYVYIFKQVNCTAPGALLEIVNR